MHHKENQNRKRRAANRNHYFLLMRDNTGYFRFSDAFEILRGPLVAVPRPCPLKCVSHNTITVAKISGLLNQCMLSPQREEGCFKLLQFHVRGEPTHQWSVATAWFLQCPPHRHIAEVANFTWSCDYTILCAWSSTIYWLKVRYKLTLQLD